MIYIPNQYLQASLWTLVGQLSLMLGMVISTILLPEYSMNGGGISNYGVEPQTVLFYSIGFILAAVGALVSSYLLRGNNHHNARLVSRSLVILATLYILVLVSTYPYQLSSTLKNIHQATSTALYMYMVVLSAYLTFNMPRTRVNRGLRYALFGSVGIAICTYINIVNLLFLGEIMTGLLFGIILVKYLRLIEK